MLISGEPRTMVFKEQVRFFTNLLNEFVKQGHIVHTYCLFRLNEPSGYIQSEEGLLNFTELMNILQPKMLDFFHKVRDEEKLVKRFNQLKPINIISQLTSIDYLIKKAYESKEYKYDMFLRIRPDCVFDGELNINNMNLDKVYTGVRCDAPASDQIFICNRKMIETWWIRDVRSSLNYLPNLNVCTDLSPEYYMFNSCPIEQVVANGLIRDYNVIVSWIKYCHDSQDSLIIPNYWVYDESYLRLKIMMEHGEFIKKLKVNTTTFCSKFMDVLHY